MYIYIYIYIFGRQYICRYKEIFHIINDDLYKTSFLSSKNFHIRMH